MILSRVAVFLVKALQLVLGMYSQGEVAETSPVIRNIGCVQAYGGLQRLIPSCANFNAGGYFHLDVLAEIGFQTMPSFVRLWGMVYYRCPQNGLRQHDPSSCLRVMLDHVAS